MKRLLWAVGGFCAASLGFLVLSCGRTQQANVLAREPSEPWEDPHTVA